jgi:hypothetical protein
VAKRTPENNRRRLIQEQRKKARAQERRKTVATIVICSLVGALLIGASVYFGTKGDGGGGSDLAMREVGLAVEAAACAEDKKEEPKGEASHVPGQVQYNPFPPTSGPHNGSTLPVGRKKFYSREDNPAPEQAVHNLEHAYVVVWYDSRATEEQVQRLRDAADAAESKFLVVPWTRGDFTGEKHIVLTAWGVRKECSDVSGAVIQKFIDDHGGFAGIAPEKNAI